MKEREVQPEKYQGSHMFLIVLASHLNNVSHTETTTRLKCWLSALKNILEVFTPIVYVQTVTFPFKDKKKKKKERIKKVKICKWNADPKTWIKAEHQHFDLLVAVSF